MPSESKELTELNSMSQVSCVGEPHPRTWDDYEAGCLSTFHGGIRDPEKLDAFQHGMATVFNLLRAEFPPAEVCKSAARLTQSTALLEAGEKLSEACQDAADWLGNEQGTYVGVKLLQKLEAALSQYQTAKGTNDTN